MFGEAPLVSLLDHHLRAQTGSRACLVRHAGKQARLRLPLLSARFAISEQGGLMTADPEHALDADIVLGPELLAALALGESTALTRAQVTGDGALAADIAAALARFDWALALRPYLGDLLAARAAQAMGRFSAWRAQAHDRLGRTLAEYATFDSPLLADKVALRRFIDEVDVLRDDAARLEARLILLERTRA
ncbi:MAG: hypothetical protein ACOZB0_11570 [Pseudomonadota bacterium]